MRPLAALSRPTTTRIVRCLSVSAFTTTISLVMLAALAGAWGVTSWVANVTATAIGTVPSYVLNRRWVWRRGGAGDPWREVAPFWVMSFAGLALSTVAVAAADRWATAVGVMGVTRTALLLAANVTAFGSLWVAQFLLLDRVLFARPIPASVPPDALVPAGDR